MSSRSILYAKMAIGMAIAYQLLAIAMIALRPDLGVYWHTISEWAIGKYGWIMQCAFVFSGLSYLFLLLAIQPIIGGRPGKLGLALMFTCFAGTVGVGIFVSDPFPPDFTIIRTLIHTLCGTLAMLLLPIAALLISRSLVTKNSRFMPLKNILTVTAFLPLAAFIAFIIHLNFYVIPLGASAAGENVPIGYPPRLLFLMYHAWLIIAALSVIKHHTQLLAAG